MCFFPLSVEIDLSKHFTPELIEYKRMFLKHLKEIMLLNKDENPAVKMNTSGQAGGSTINFQNKEYHMPGVTSKYENDFFFIKKYIILSNPFYQIEILGIINFFLFITHLSI